MRFGIDLGGTKTEIVGLGKSGDVVLRERVPTPAASYDGIIRVIRDLVSGCEARLGVGGASVGIGIPGAVSPQSGLIKNANTVCLIGKPLQRDLETALGRPVRLANDANCFALSEASDGAGRGHAVVFGVILGTGVGGGIVVHGRVLEGPNAIAGEWGHNPLPWPRDDERPGPSCYCGRAGCIETFVSGPGFRRDHLARTKQAPDTVDASPSTIFAAAEAGDAGAGASADLYLDRLARSLASVMNVLDPDVIVLGGGLSNIARLYRDVPDRWRGFVFSDHVVTKLVPAAHGDSSGVRGAAWLWPVTDG